MLTPRLLLDTLHGADDLRVYFPNVLFAPRPSLRGAGDSLPCLALVALRSIADEEVLLNYRLNPSLPSLPPWYHSVDEEEDRRRWS